MSTVVALATQPAVDPAELHRLVTLATSLAPADGVFPTAFPGLSVIRFSRSSAALPTVYEPCLCVVLQGRKRTTVGEQNYVYHPGRFLVVSLSLAARAHVIEASPSAPYLCLRFALDVPRIASLLLRTPVAQPVDEIEHGLFLAPLNRGLSAALLRLLESIEHVDELEVMATLLSEELHYRLLTGPMGHRLAALVDVSGHAHGVAVVIDHIKQHFAEPLRVAELAALVQMSSSSLNYRFKQLTSMTPLHYQKQLRLHEASRLMLSDGVGAADAGFRVGYASPSQFSREFRRLFGAPPTQRLAAVAQTGNA